MSDLSTPAEVFQRFITGIGEGRWLELATMYAEDAVVRLPMQVPEPGQVTGRDAVGRHFAAASRSTIQIRPYNIVIHTTSDPEVIIAEFDYDVRDSATGRESTMSNVQVLRIRDGLIRETRDYHDHLRFAVVAGAADKLVAALR